MFATFKQIFRASNKDLRARVLFTLGVLFIFALGNSITIPGMNVITGDIGFLELFNAMSGGGLKQFSIFALGVMPYITASIIMQLLQMDIKDLIALYRKKSIVIGRMVYYHDKLYKAIGVSNLGYLILKNEIEEICISCDEINLKESLR